MSAQDAGTGSGAAPLVEVRDIARSFGGVRALRGVSFGFNRGEVLALVGDNGAGKSTLVKILAGALQPDSGAVLIDGEPVCIDSPHIARELGIETVFQDLALVETQSVVSNLFMNREIVRKEPILRQLGWLDRTRMKQETTDVLDRLGIKLDSLDQSVGRLSGGQRQAIAVGRAVAWGRRVVVLDEPTAALGVEQSRLILELIDTLRNQGTAVLVISHNMQDVLKVCDRAIVLRHGREVADLTIEGATVRDLVDLITGAVEQEPPQGHGASVPSH